MGGQKRAENSARSARSVESGFPQSAHTRSPISDGSAIMVCAHLPLTRSRWSRAFHGWEPHDAAWQHFLHGPVLFIKRPIIALSLFIII
jgi:hypothetical protein